MNTILTLQQYIDSHYKGSKAEFARAFGRLPQGVTKMFRNVAKWQVILSDDEHRVVEVRASRQTQCIADKQPAQHQQAPHKP